GGDAPDQVAVGGRAGRPLARQRPRSFRPPTDSVGAVRRAARRPPRLWGAAQRARWTRDATRVGDDRGRGTPARRPPRAPGAAAGPRPARLARTAACRRGRRGERWRRARGGPDGPRDSGATFRRGVKTRAGAYRWPDTRSGKKLGPDEPVPSASVPQQ